MSESINEKIALSQKHSSVDVGSDSTSQVISSISHELRTPLAIISSNIQLLKKFNYSLDERIVGETFMLCEEAVNSMTRFIDDIYFLNVSNKGEVKMNKEAVDLPLFFSKIVEKVSDSDFNRKRLNVQLDFSESAFFVDKILLERILINLIDNALKFSSDVVNLVAISNSCELNVLIEDSGVGIPTNEIENIFDPFKRGSNVKMITGCGLGLAIVKKCIEIVNGEIEIESVVDQGTKIKLKILNHEC